MNVAKYIKRERAPKPTIHENHFVEEFRNPRKFGRAGPQRIAIAEEIAGSRPFPIHKGEKVHLDNFAYDAHERIRAGEHPWEVFGSYGGPLSLELESKLLYNPHDLDDKGVFLARWQEQQGTANDFSQRLENIESGVSLVDIKNENTEYEGELQKLKNALNESFEKYPKVVDTLYKQKKAPIDAKHKERKEMMAEDVAAKKRQPRAKVVVEPVVGKPTASATPPPRTPVPITPVRKPVVGAGEEKQVDDSSSDEETEQEVNTPAKGTEDFHAMLDSLEQISTLLETPGDISEADIKTARKFFADGKIPLSRKVKSKLGLIKAYNRHVEILETRKLISSDEFPKLAEKRRRK